MDWKKGAQYWDHAWNPVIGCKPVSEGCRNCYAASMAQRFPELQDETGGFLPHPPKAPKAPPKSGVVFVGNMTDLFGEWNTDQQICNWLYYLPCTATYLTLTKRADRMNRLARYWEVGNITPGSPHWFGITAENQTKFIERMAFFWDLKLDHKWLSLEPLLDSIDLSDMGEYFCPKCNSGFTCPEKYNTPCCGVEIHGGDDYECPKCGENFGEGCEVVVCPICGNDGNGHWIQADHVDCFGSHDLNPLKSIKWVVVGAESGPNRRPCKLEWVESIVEQCKSAGVPVFVKQLDIGGKLVKDIEKFPAHLQIRQVPWGGKE